MSVIDHVQSFLLQDDVEKMLATVEAVMFKTLRSHQSFDTHGQVNARDAAAYHLKSGGHRVRARLALASGLASGLPSQDSLCIATCSELMHNASLIHDDIQDQDLLRRGQPALWSKFGSDIAICSGDYLLSAAYSVLSGFSQPLLLPSMLALLHERTATAIDGQCADLTMRNDLSDGVERYMKIAKAKSGALLSLPLELVLIASGQSHAASLARKACENFAVSYQIFDDLEDAVADAKPDLASSQHPRNLNIVLILMNPKKLSVMTDLMTAQDMAIDIGLQHLAFCEALALQMPKGTGALLLDLSAKLGRMFDAFSPEYGCKCTQS